MEQVIFRGGENSAQAMPSGVVAVVVTHNRPDQLATTLQRLLGASQSVLRAVVVVDNASGPETAQVLASKTDPRLVVCRSDANIGGAGGFDLGLRHAVAAFDPDWLLLMDDDARPDPEALARFAAGRAEGRYKGLEAVAGAVFYPDGRICEMNRPSRNPFWSPRIFLRTLFGQGRDGYHIAQSAYQDRALLPIDIASFVGIFLSREAVQRRGYPDPKLFLYGDDVLYTLGLRRRGGQMSFDPALRFEHDCSTFSDDQKRVWKPVWKVYYTYRNGLLMYRYAAGPLFWLLLPLLVFKWTRAAKGYGAEREIYLGLMRLALRHALTRRDFLEHEDLLARVARAKV